MFSGRIEGISETNGDGKGCRWRTANKCNISVNLIDTDLTTIIAGTGRYMIKKSIRVALGMLVFAIGCSTPRETTNKVANHEMNLEKSRQIAEQFIRSHPKFISDHGKELTVIAVEPLRCRSCWVFDYRYVTYVRAEPRKKYMSVVVQKGKPSIAIAE